MTAQDEGFLRRWSRRKAETRDEPAETDARAGPVAAPAREEAGGALATTAETEAESPPLDLPDIETLGKESDYTPFMQPGVPEDLKIRALRKLWRSDPVLANLDGLNDYDEDFQALHKVGQEFMRTAYKAAEKAADKIAAADGEGATTDEVDDEAVDAPVERSDAPDTRAAEGSAPDDSPDGAAAPSGSV